MQYLTAVYEDESVMRKRHVLVRYMNVLKSGDLLHKLRIVGFKPNLRDSTDRSIVVSPRSL